MISKNASLTCHRSHGVQGKLDRASKAQIENDLGSKHEEDAVKVILEKGQVQDTKTQDKQGIKNESNANGAQ
jgi:ribosome maturation protein Sdo1